MQAETTYNWDDIQVGRFDLNHSENFFTQKHLKHEKYSEEFNLIRAMASTNMDDSFSNDIAIESIENKENTQPPSNKTENSRNKIKLENLSIKNEPVSVKDHPLSPVNDQKQNELEVKHEKPVIKSSTSPAESNTNRRPANLLTKFKTPQTYSKTNCGAPSAVGKTEKSKVEPPHAYDFKDIYKKKKEEMMQKLLEEEKKNRVFRSRPAPKSVAMPVTRKTQVEYHLTAPKTPVVLKNSREADEKRRQRLEEYKRKNAPPKFVSRDPVVLNEEPFKPKKTCAIVQPQPFNLHVERRLEERKQYDVQNRLVAEEKKKQEEEERKKREEELVKELRKLASFKARPNPFK